MTTVTPGKYDWGSRGCTGETALPDTPTPTCHSQAGEQPSSRCRSLWSCLVHTAECAFADSDAHRHDGRCGHAVTCTIVSHQTKSPVFALSVTCTFGAPAQHLFLYVLALELLSKTFPFMPQGPHLYLSF